MITCWYVPGREQVRRRQGEACEAVNGCRRPSSAKWVSAVERDTGEMTAAAQAMRGSSRWLLDDAQSVAIVAQYHELTKN